MKYFPTGLFIHSCRDFEGEKRIYKIAKNLNLPPKLLKQNYSKLTPLFEFIKKSDVEYHDIAGDENDEIFFDVAFHNHVASDLKSLIVLCATNMNYQANMVLRHLIECVIFSVWSDLTCRFTGAFNYLLEDAANWKPYIRHQGMIWETDDSSKKIRSIKDRLERIRLQNNSKIDSTQFQNEYFGKASACDFSLLFSLPICRTCLKKKESEISYGQFRINEKARKLGKEDPHAVFKTDFGNHCHFCNSSKETKAFAHGIPKLSDMINMLKTLHANKSTKDLITLYEVYGFLSDEFVHFSATKHPDENPPLCNLTGIGRKKIWGFSGVNFCIKTMKPVFDHYFTQMRKAVKVR